MASFNWVFDKANNVWLPAPAVVVPKRMAAAGQVIAGAHWLYWIHMNPSAGNSILVLTDAIAALAATLFDDFHTDKEGHLHPFNPPLPFSTGIYLETFTNMTSVLFGYV